MSRARAGEARPRSAARDDGDTGQRAGPGQGA